MEQKFRLTPSVIASYFKHRCDRQFRWLSVEERDRGRAGIGWNIPRRPGFHTRPGITLLMEAGDVFELDRLAALGAEHGRDQVYHAGLEEEGGRQRVRPLPLAALAEQLRRPNPPRFFAQILLDLENVERVGYPLRAGNQPALHGFLERFGLDPARVRLGTGRPDLLELIPDGGRPLLRVWDFKASQTARHEHFIQVAFYTLLLEHALPAAGLDDFAVDTALGVIYSREGADEFALAPYRLAVEEFLRRRLMPLLDTEAGAAHYHVSQGCPMCQYHTSCRDEADAFRDLSRVAYMTSESKRRLVRHGIRSHRELAQLSAADPLWPALKAAGHDLSLNLERYVAVAQALDDGRPRSLDSRSLMIPRREDVAVYLSAEQDPVTNTCFALGLKVTEWQGAGRPPRKLERAYLLDNPLGTRGQGPGAREERSSLAPGPEATLLLDFLRDLNELLLRVDAENAAVAAQLDEEAPEMAAARLAAEAAAADLAAFKAAHPRLYHNKPDHQPLLRQRDALTQAEKSARETHKRALSEAAYQNRRRQKRLHFYIYDGYDLTVLKRLVERHLFSGDPALLRELYTLVRLFPPESLLPDADSFRTIPGTVLIAALRQLVALPAPYVYDLRTVTELLPVSPSGYEPARLRQSSSFVPYGTNQVAFERIHDVWQGNSFQPDRRQPPMPPEEIRRRVERAVIAKLRATESVGQWIKDAFGDNLLLRKEPFRLYTAFDPLGFHMLEALRVFTILETSHGEIATKHLHTLPVADRVARFECISGLRYIEGADEPDGSLWFTFDPVARDVKFERGAFDLVLTPQDSPERLVSEIDGPLFDGSRWRHNAYKVSLLDYDLTADPPRVRLLPAVGPARFRENVDLSAVHALDKVFVDYNTGKVLAVLDALRQSPEMARHVHELLDTAATSGWRPLIGDAAGVEAALRRHAPPGARFLTAAQQRAFRGVPAAPLSLIWGPPGTGKTFMLAHLLLAYVVAAREQGRPVRILVSAFTHNAINNVLGKVAEMLAAYGLDGDATVIKVRGSDPPADDRRLPPAVAREHHKNLPGLLGSSAPCLIVGSTVWGVYNAMKDSGVMQPWFDVVLIDEASQMKLAEALVAFSASRPEGAVILAGDDRQLPPIIHGDYPAEHEHMLSSVFAYMRQRIESREQAEPGFEARTIFQLEENFRMNKPLTDYPGQILYNNRFYSQQKDIRITTQPPLAADSDDLIDFLLHPDRPVVLVRYAAPAGFTARNPLEAELVARLAVRLADILIPPFKDEGGRVKDEEERMRGDSSSFIPHPSSLYFASDGFAVLAPHRAQNSAIRGLLAEAGFGTEERPMPLVDTVDKLQGQERDVVVVSYGVADEDYAEAEAEFLLSSNRFNVATTRPRRKLIVLCSDAVLDVVPQDREVLLEAMMLKEFRRFCDGGPVEFVWPTAAYGPVSLSVQWRAFREETTDFADFAD